MMRKDDAAIGRPTASCWRSSTPIGQEHLLAFWDRLDGRASGSSWRGRSTSIDRELFRELQAEHREQQAAGGDDKSQWAELAARAESPPAMRLDGSGVPFTPDEARAKGRKCCGPARSA